MPAPSPDPARTGMQLELTLVESAERRHAGPSRVA
jgi:hypothetical protein